MSRFPRLAVAAAAASLSFATAPAFAYAETLYGQVTEGGSITMKDATGTRVETIAPGTYTIEVTDSATSHNFHLTGPGGVAVTTGDPSATGTFTWTVTLVAGTYSYVCDPHSGFMNGSFTVADPPAGFGLTVAKGGGGSGTVTSEPAGIDCGPDCSATFASGELVTLRATARGDSVFAGWAGACAHAGPTGVCEVAMDAARTVTATFTYVAAARLLSLRATKAGAVRRVVARLTFGRAVTVKVVVSRNGRTLARLQATAAPGTRALRLRIPRSVRAGYANVRVTVRDSFGSVEVFARRVRIRA